jgi:hypothetical protein
MLALVKHMVLETISVTGVFAAMHRIAELCANSKRNRLPPLYRLLVPK